MELMQMSTNQLRSVAFDMGVEFDENTSRADLILAIQHAEALREMDEVSAEEEGVTDYTEMSREEIREHLTTAIGDAELPEAVREALVLVLEDREGVTPDEFWTIVEQEFERYENS